jgi:hypothetical protein
MLSKIVQRTTFSPWSESPTLPFVRFICQAKSHNFHPILDLEEGTNLQMTAMSLR